MFSFLFDENLSLKFDPKILIDMREFFNLDQNFLNETFEANVHFYLGTYISELLNQFQEIYSENFKANFMVFVWHKILENYYNQTLVVRSIDQKRKPNSSQFKYAIKKKQHIEIDISNEVL